MSSFLEDASPVPDTSPPETPGLKRKSKLSLGLIRPKVNVNVSNAYDELEDDSPIEKRGLKTDINKHESNLKGISDEYTEKQSNDLFSDDIDGSLLNRESELPVPSTFLKVRSMKGPGSYSLKLEGDAFNRFNQILSKHESD